ELEDLCRLVALAARKLAPAGTLLLETPNPYNEDARRHFWLDPTHVRPVHPELAQFLAESAGFPLAEIHYPGEEAWLAERERRRRRTWWDRLRGRRLAARPVPSAEVPRRPLTLAEGILFPDYALLARQKGAVNS
ncbi:MAG: hypothetical protein ACE5H3_10730, partial [Planctomycetota bacterium]